MKYAAINSPSQAVSIGLSNNQMQTLPRLSDGEQAPNSTNGSALDIRLRS